MKVWAILFLAILSETVATTALKASDGMTRIGPSLVVVLGYGAAFVLLAQTLRLMPVGLAYAIWSGVGIVLVTIAGWVLYDQTLDLAALLGMAMIVAGVVVMNLCSGSLTH